MLRVWIISSNNEKNKWSSFNRNLKNFESIMNSYKINQKTLLEIRLTNKLLFDKLNMKIKFQKHKKNLSKNKFMIKKIILKSNKNRFKNYSMKFPKKVIFNIKLLNKMLKNFRKVIKK